MCSTNQVVLTATAIVFELLRDDGLLSGRLTLLKLGHPCQELLHIAPCSAVSCSRWNLRAVVGLGDSHGTEGVVQGLVQCCESLTTGVQSKLPAVQPVDVLIFCELFSDVRNQVGIRQTDSSAAGLAEIRQTGLAEIRQRFTFSLSSVPRGEHERGQLGTAYLPRHAQVD
eukprot:scpid100786/ scgid6709/ 